VNPTRPDTADPPDTGHADGPGAFMQLLAAVMLILPLAGIALHVYMYFRFSGDAVSGYIQSIWLKVFAFLAFAILVGNWFHYRATRMKVDLASRILTYVWVISMILLFRRIAD